MSLMISCTRPTLSLREVQKARFNQEIGLSLLFMIVEIDAAQHTVFPRSRQILVPVDYGLVLAVQRWDNFLW